MSMKTKDYLKQGNLANNATQSDFLGEITTYSNSTKSTEAFKKKNNNIKK